jgi:hypothetical protein
MQMMKKYSARNQTTSGLYNDKTFTLICILIRVHLCFKK